MPDCWESTNPGESMLLTFGSRSGGSKSGWRTSEGIKVPATKSEEARQLPCVDRPDFVAGTNGGRHRSVPDDHLGADEL